MSSNSQSMKEIGVLKDSEAYKYFNQYEHVCKFVKTHKREASMHVNNSEYEYVSSIGMKRKRVN